MDMFIFKPHSHEYLIILIQQKKIFEPFPGWLLGCSSPGLAGPRGSSETVIYVGDSKLFLLFFNI